MTNGIQEIENSECLFIIGSNATKAHPIIGNKMMQSIRHKGAKSIVVDPRVTELAEVADIHLQIKSGTDVALINSIMHVIIENGWQDDEFIEDRTNGYDEIVELVKDYPPSVAAEICGVKEEDIIAAAEIYAKTEKAGIYYTLGITEHTTGTENVMSLSNLALLTGHVGKESTGINPIRGQNNVQGACDMGALPNTYPGYQPVNSEEAHEFFEKAWDAKLSKEIGLTIPKMLDDAEDFALKAMYVMGEDPVLSDADANHVRHALESLDFLVVQDLYMTPTAELADIFLPGPTYAEKEGTFTNTERRVQRVRKAIDSPGEARGDWQIICELAKRMGYEKQFDFKSAEDIFEGIREASPAYRGMTYERMGNVGLQWPCPTTSHPGTPFLHKGIFAKGRADFRPATYKDPAELPDQDYPFLLGTGRMLYHYNVMTRNSKSLNSIRPGELCQIHPVDAEKYGLQTYDAVRVYSRRGKIDTLVEVTDKVKPGMLWMTFHFKESPVNELTNSAFDPITDTAEYKVCAVSIEKLDEIPTNLKKPHLRAIDWSQVEIARSKD